jgi:choline-sulfatase
VTRWPTSVLLLLTGLLGLAAIGCSSPDRGPPNVLLVSIDTLRADHVGAYGARFASTPTLDSLSAGGVRFEWAIAPTPLTLPSHATLLTALDPPHHGVRHNGIQRLTSQVETLAERLGAAGWTTGAVVGSLVLAEDTGLGRGFDHYDDQIRTHGEHLEGQRRAEEVNAAALGWLETAEQPFFLFVHYYDPHATYEPPPPFDSRSEHPYDGEIAYVDAMLGQLLDGLREPGELERTLVVVTADHGESMGEHDELTHSYSIYDATQHVPLVMSGPGVPAGRVVDGVVRTADVAPTLLAQLGLPAMAGVDGADLSPLWAEGKASDRIAYVESMATQIDNGWSPLHGLRTPQHLYIRAPRPELYRVIDDAGQKRNLLTSATRASTQRAAAMEQVLQARLAKQRDASEVAITAERRAQLHALGYAIPETPSTANRLDPKDGRRMLGRYDEAVRLATQGQHRAAAAVFEELLAALPESILMRRWLGSAWLNAGELDGAEKQALAVLELAPERDTAWFKLGVIRMEQGRPAEAVDAFRRSIELNPRVPGPHFSLVKALLASGRLEEAIAQDARISAEAIGNVSQLRELADAWELAGHPQMALTAYRRVLEREPDSPRDHMHLAIQLIRLDREEEARAHLGRAGDVATQPKAQRALARAYLAQGEDDPAREVLSALLLAEPDDAWANSALQALGRRDASRISAPPAAPARH